MLWGDPYASISGPFSGGHEGSIPAMAPPSKSKHWGPTYLYFGPTHKAKAGTMDPLGPQIWGRFSVRLQGLAGRGTDQGPRDKLGLRRTNRGPAERIGALWNGSEPRWANQGPQDESGHWDGSGAEGRARALQNKSEPAGHYQGPGGRIAGAVVGPGGSNQGHLGRIWAPQDQSIPRDGSGPAERINVLRD